ncbi:MAG: CRISPR system precrRNA processing endoribonuclease RAMP protein Cas6 [Candidatus Hydrogenedens sp.]
MPEYKGSMIRGALGHALKKVSCALKRFTCPECPIREKCAYSMCFETPIPKSSEIMKKYPKAPHPYILEPPIESKERYEPGEVFECNLTLVGRAKDFLPHFIYALDVMAEEGFGRGRGKSKLISLDYLTPENKWNALYSPEANEFLGEPYSFKIQDILQKKEQLLLDKRIEIQYITPTRLVIDGNLHDTGEIAYILPGLLRRLTLLQYFFCGGYLEKDVISLVEAGKNLQPLHSAFQWQDWVRYSSRQDRKVIMGGFIVSIVYEQIPSEILEVLCWGERLHIGKGTVFGLGKYNLLPAN